MSDHYHILPSGHLESSATFHKPVQNLPERVTLNSPALDVMTDFKIVTAYTIFPLESIEEAQHKMIHRGVRLLLVVEDVKGRTNNCTNVSLNVCAFERLCVS